MPLDYKKWDNIGDSDSDAEKKSADSDSENEGESYAQRDLREFHESLAGLCRKFETGPNDVSGNEEKIWPFFCQNTVFPPKDTLLKHVATPAFREALKKGMLGKAGLEADGEEWLQYDAMKRLLWDSGMSIGSVRDFGELLDKKGGMPMMQWHFVLLHEIVMDPKFFGPSKTPAVNNFRFGAGVYISVCWDDVGQWVS
eukprot:gene54-109_t